MTEHQKRLRNTLLRLGVTLILLVIIACTVDLGRAWQNIRQSNWLFWGIAFLLYQVGILVRSFRWQELLRVNQIRVSLRTLVGLYYVGTFFNNFLPTGFGGDVVKMLELAQAGTDSELAVSTVLADRLVGLGILLLMALAAIPFGFKLVPIGIVLALAALVVVFFAGMGLITSRKLMTRISRWKLIGKLLGHPKIHAFMVSFQNYRSKALTKAILASLAFNILLIVVYILLGLAVGVDISPLYYMLFIPIISTLTVLPISVSGLGVREGSYMFLFSRVGVPSSQALAMSLLFYALNVVTGLAGGLIYLWQIIRGARAAKTSG